MYFVCILFIMNVTVIFIFRGVRDAKEGFR